MEQTRTYALAHAAAAVAFQQASIASLVDARRRGATVEERRDCAWQVAWASRQVIRAEAALAAEPAPTS